MPRASSTWQHYYINPETGISVLKYQEYRTLKDLLTRFPKLTKESVKQYFTCVTCGNFFGHKGRFICLDVMCGERLMGHGVQWRHGCSLCCRCHITPETNEYGLFIPSNQITAEDYYEMLLEAELDLETPFFTKEEG